jgi:choline dehydrogenase-like flavoprotein
MSRTISPARALEAADPRPCRHVTMPPPPDRSGRALPDSADVVVVGGGSTGVAAARSPAGPWAHVVTVEPGRMGGVTDAAGPCGTGVLPSALVGARVGERLGGGPAPCLDRARFLLVPVRCEERTWLLPRVVERSRLQDRRDRRAPGKAAPSAEEAR